jgi:hypothetical protein
MRLRAGSVPWLSCMDDVAAFLPWLIALAVLALLLVLLLPARPRFAPKPLLTKNEIEFFGRLRSALPELAVFPQVALRAIVRPGSPSTSRSYDREAGLIGAKHCDYLVCRPDSLAIVAIVELDDRTHQKEKDAERDRMTAAAGYRTLRFESRNKPSVAELRRIFADL